MNILWIYDSPLNPTKGGTERSTQIVADEMRRRGHSCYAFVHINQQEWDACYYQGERLESLYGFLKERRIDVVVNQIAFHPWLLTAFLAKGGDRWRAEGGRIVSMLHFSPQYVHKGVWEMIRDEWPKRDAKGKLRLLTARLVIEPKLRRQSYRNHGLGYRFCYEHSDAFVLMCEGFKAEVLRQGRFKDTGKFELITNALTFADNLPEEEIGNKEPRVLVLSRLDEVQKRVSKIIKVWWKIKSAPCAETYRLDIVGTGQDEQRYKRMVAELRLKDIEFHGHQANAIPFYKRAQIFALTSPAEGWGLTLTESLQMGVVPVVLNTCPVFATIISDGENGFLVEDMDEFVEKVQLLMSDAELRTRMSRNAIASAQRFAPSVIGDKWEALFEKIRK